MWGRRGLRSVAVASVSGALLVGVAGCGTTSTTVSTTVAGTPGVVTVVVTSPTSGSVINADSVTVRGTVTPLSAAVMVQGKPAAVGNGIFNADATLHAGRTTIDVIGSAAGDAPGSTSVTITRQGAAPAAPRPATSGGSGTTGGGATPGVAYAPAGSGTGQTSCGGGLSVGPNTTCSFAQNVEAAYRSNGPGTVDVFSPVTNQTYSMTCNNQSSGVVCTGANNATVYFP
jgi:hypothetical protein